MEEKKLTICIPTYNRCAKVCKQIEVVSELFKKHSHFYELIVLNNCSTDDTISELVKLQSKYDFTIINNEVNIGMLPNILKCYSVSKTEFTWVLGDDDNVSNLDTEDLLNELNTNKEVGLFQFDCKVIDGITNEIDKEFYYYGKNHSTKISKNEFANLIKLHGFSPSMWISGNIYKTTTVLSAIKKYDSTIIIALPLFYSLYTALRFQNVVILKSNQVEMIINTTSWGKKQGTQIPIIDLNIVNNLLKNSNELEYNDNLIFPVTNSSKVFYRYWFDVFYNQGFVRGKDLAKLSIADKGLNIIDIPIIFTYGLLAFYIKKYV